MAWFQLDPTSIAARAHAATPPAQPPTLLASLLRGTLGFTLVSLAGFAPWAVWGRALYRSIGEAGLYAVCAVVFIVLSGIFLHRLIIGPGSLARFYKLFSPAFAAYSVVWIIGWMTFRGHTGSIVGLLGGAVVLGWLLTRAFDAGHATMQVIAVLFLLNTAGYFVGGWFEAALIDTQPLLAKMLWGVWYGLGFGAGLALAFYLCQGRARALIAGARRDAGTPP